MERDSLLSYLEKVIKYDGLSKNFDHPCLTGFPFHRSITVVVSYTKKTCNENSHVKFDWLG